MTQNRTNRRQHLRRILAGAAALAITSPVCAQLGGGGGGGLGGGGNDNDNNDKNKKNKNRNRAQQVMFNVSGEGKTRFAFDFKPTADAGQIVVNLMTYDEKAKRYAKAMEIGTFKRAIKKTTNGVPLRPGKYAIELMGGGFSYSVTVEHGSGEGDNASYSKIASKSGKV